MIKVISVLQLDIRCTEIGSKTIYEIEKSGKCLIIMLVMVILYAILRKWASYNSTAIIMQQYSIIFLEKIITPYIL